MPTQTTTDGENRTTTTGAERAHTARVDRATTRIRELNDRLMAAASSAGRVYLDGYENAVRNLVDLEKRIGEGSRIDWINSLTRAHADLVADVSTAYTKAARDLLN